MGTKPKAQVPADLTGARKQQIDFLQNMLGFGQGGFGAGGGAANRLQSFFGSLSPTQPGAAGGQGNPLDQFINTPSPEQRALDINMPMLQDIISGKATPGLERGIAMANQGGGRFSSGNEIMRGEALGHLLQQQLAAGSQLGQLSQAAGAGQQRQFGMADTETQRRLQLMSQLLSVLQGPTIGAPVTAGKSAFENIVGGIGAATSAIGALKPGK